MGDQIEECGFTGGSLMIAMFAIQIGAQGLGQVRVCECGCMLVCAWVWVLVCECGCVG